MCDLVHTVPFPTHFHLVATQLLSVQDIIRAATQWAQPFPAANYVSCPIRYSQSNMTGDTCQACC